MKKTIFIISISDPILIGIYSNNILQETIKSTEKTSDVLPNIIKNILKDGHIDEFIYVNGPGSHMSIKLTYIFLKTLSISLNIPLLSISGFDTNKKSPIKALGKKYFYLNNNNKIILRSLENNEKVNDFYLPQAIDYLLCSKNILPNYQLPVV